jgi:L-iditol 2-dehydrogenase
VSATVRAARVVAPGQVELVTTPAPEPAAGQAQLRPELVTLCGSDLRTVYSGGAEAYPLPPGVSGHEIVARVTAPDPAATAPDGLAAGARVLALVTQQQGMAERFVTSCSDLLRLPDELPAEHLVLAQQLGTVVYGCQQVGNVVARSAVVIGQGSAGLFFVAMLRRLGADRILALDLSDARIAAGLRMGADEAYHGERDDPVARVAEFTGGAMADLVVEAAGTPSAVNLTPRLARRGGRILFFGLPKQDTFPVDFYTLFRAQCRITSASGAAEEPGKRSFRIALDLIVRGAIDVAGLVSHLFPLQEAARAYELARSRADGALKVGVRFDGP